MSTERAKRTALLVLHHAKKHTGVGIVCAVAYFDPQVLRIHYARFSHDHARSGNWGVDLQAGSQFGYRLLFVVLLAGIFAIFFQVASSPCVLLRDLTILAGVGQ